MDQSPASLAEESKVHEKKSLHQHFESILALNASARLLAAWEELQILRSHLASLSDNNSSVSFSDSDVLAVKTALSNNSQLISELEERVKDVRSALASISTTDQPASSSTTSSSSPSSSTDEWIFGMTFLGVTTHYKVEEDGLLSVKIQGQQDLPLFEALCVINEVDLFNEWVPCCNRSQLVQRLANAELLAYVSLFVPPMSRDTVVHAYGVDCLCECGKIVIMAASVDEDHDGSSKEGEERGSNSSSKKGGNDLPCDSTSSISSSSSSSSSEVTPAAPYPTPYTTPPYQSCGWFHNRVDVKSFIAVVEPVSPSSARMTIIARADPKTVLPQVIINFVIRNLAGLMLYFFQQKVRLSIIANAATVCTMYNLPHSFTLPDSHILIITFILIFFNNLINLVLHHALS